MSQHHDSEDPCADFGPTQRWAVVWMIAVLIIGSVLTYKLSAIDNWMYKNNGEFLDYSAYRDNRQSSYGIGYAASESVDPRAHGDLQAALTRGHLIPESKDQESQE